MPSGPSRLQQLRFRPSAKDDEVRRTAFLSETGRMLILLVEDHEDTRRAMATLLGMSGHVVGLAATTAPSV